MKTVLIIDDDTQLQALYKQSLENAGYAVLQAFSGTEGLSVAFNKTPDLVLLDLMMPGGMNGFEVLQKIKKDKKLSKLKILVFTNLPGEEAEVKLLGVKDYILKSDVSAPELPKIIRTHFSWFGL
jgi:DNA-binding response OmpR family regulator